MTFQNTRAQGDLKLSFYVLPLVYNVLGTTIGTLVSADHFELI